ncbi:MAG: hypothetical protein OYL97_21480 [Candidatus Poribacteria bacterium]|nr:hypothetical protein [Candidatus Poribacteria bacterium]
MRNYRAKNGQLRPHAAGEVTNLASEEGWVSPIKFDAYGAVSQPYLSVKATLLLP